MEKEITIDASGRLVIPKEARSRHRLSGGSRLILTVDDEKITLVPRRAVGVVREKNGLLVIQGRLGPELLDHRDDRDDRLDRLSCL
jgi:AbrB family looped-hinge helix DNA binding protein